MVMMVGTVYGNRKAQLKIITVHLHFTFKLSCRQRDTWRVKKRTNYDCVGHLLTETPRHSFNTFIGLNKKNCLRFYCFVFCFFHVTLFCWFCFDCLSPGYLPAVMRSFWDSAVLQNPPWQGVVGWGGVGAGCFDGNQVNCWVSRGKQLPWKVVIIISHVLCQKVLQDVHRHTIKSPVCHIFKGAWYKTSPTWHRHTGFL